MTAYTYIYCKSEILLSMVAMMFAININVAWVKLSMPPIRFLWQIGTQLPHLSFADISSHMIYHIIMTCMLSAAHKLLVY